MGQVWSVAGSAFGTYSSGSLANYTIALAEQGTSRFYAATFPSGIPLAGVYTVVVYVRAGGSPAEGDAVARIYTIDWYPSVGSLGASNANAASIAGATFTSLAGNNLSTFWDNNGDENGELLTTYPGLVDRKSVV